MREFKYLDYWTEYACKGIIQRQMQGSACFMEIFNSFSNRDIINEQYKIKVYKGVEKVNEHKSNACFLEPLQIKNHLKQIKSLFPFKFHIRLYRNYYIIYLKLHNQPGIYHKYLLTWLRYIYEFPYNVLLLDALKLKKEKCFRFTSISNLFNLILGCWPDPDMRTIHQIPRLHFSQMMKKSQIKEKLLKIDNLNDLYEIVKNKDWEEGSYLKSTDLYNLEDLEYWTDSSIYEELRKPVYLNVYNKIIKKK